MKSEHSVYLIGGFCAAWGLATCKTGYVLPCIKTSIDTYNAVQTLAGLFVIAGVVVATAQYVISSKALTEERQARIEEARAKKTLQTLEQVSFLKNPILRNVNIVLRILRESGLQKVHFDIGMHMDGFRFLDEAMKFYDQLREIKTSYKFYEICADEGLVKDMPIDGIVVETKGIETKPPCYQLTSSKSRLCETEYRKHVVNILDDLERFAMYFISGMADESEVNRAFQLEYVSAIQLLRVEIATYNQKTEICDNAIALYEKWNEKLNKDRENRRKRQ